MHERGSDHPEDPAAAHLLHAEQFREHAVVHRPLARHFRRHKSEFVGTVGAAEKTLDVHEDPFGAVLRRSDRDLVALAHAARLGDHQVVAARLHDHAVHARQAGTTPSARQLHVRRQIRGRKKTVGKNPVGRCGSESRLGRAR